MFLRNDNSRGGVHSLVAKSRVAGVSLMGRTLTYTLHLPCGLGQNCRETEMHHVKKSVQICLVHNKCSILNTTNPAIIVFKCFLNHNSNKAILLLRVLQWRLVFPELQVLKPSF